jgi:pimeloyl-ACP methyl ester carboxylesterase
LLRDGRQLGFAEWGDPGGTPVVFFHGMPSCRLNGHANTAVLDAHHARWIAIDRPGIGLSDFQPQRTLLDWPDDVVQLADGLGFDRFGVVGVSAGGPYAAACAFKTPERLTHVGIVSGVAPFDRLGVDEQRKRETFSDRRVPWLGRAKFKAMAVAARRWPDWTFEQVLKDMPEPDRIIASRPEVRLVLVDAFLEAVRSGVRGVEHEMALHSTPWGFQPEEIAIRVELWHGDQDTNVPLSEAMLLADAIPNSNLSVCPGVGHLLIDERFEEILSALTR